jgi:enoyl-CoA hydratase
LSDEVVSYVESGRRATITITREDRRNALSPDVVAGIAAGLDRAEKNHEIGAVVLTGAGDKAFCAGGDLGGMTPQGAVQQHFIRAEIGDLFKQMRALRVPVVARVNGHALAGGFGLMLACDLVVAAEHAQLGTPEINLGLWPFMITTVIQRDLPRKVALELMLTGRRMEAEEAARWGFVNRVVPSDTLDKAVDEMIEQLLSKSPLIASLGRDRSTAPRRWPSTTHSTTSRGCSA